MNKKVAFALMILALVLPVEGLCESVVWMNATNVSVSGGTLTKTNSGTNWDAGASSANVIRDGYGWMEFTAPSTNAHRMAGLSYGDTNQDYTDIDYAINFRGDGSVKIYESGTFRVDVGSYVTNDVFRVEVRYGVVRYLKNGSLLYTSAVIPRYPLRVDTTIRDQNGVISDVHIGNLVWTGASGVAVARQSLTKTGSAGWNAGASSTNTIESGSDGFLEFTATETNTLRMAGLANGDSNQSDSDVEFAIQLRADGNVEIFESGTSQGSTGGYAAADKFRVEVIAGVVYYRQNGSLLYTSSVTPAFPLRADTSLNSVGATLTDVTLESLVWTNATGVTVEGARLVKTAANGWNATASSSRTIEELDGWVEFTALETNTLRVIGLKGSGAATDYEDIDFAMELGSSGVVQIWESGTSRGTFGSYVAGDRLRIEIQDGVVRYRKNGSSLYLSSVEPTYPLHAEATLYTNGATLADVAIGETVWRSEVNLNIIGNTLQKVGGSAATWDTGAFGTKAVNTGAVEWTAFEVTTRMIGLGNVNSGVSYTDLDFGLHQRSNGTIAIYESGTLKSEVGSYASGDRFKVEVVSAVVKYYKNGSLLYTSSITPTLPLSIDTAFYDVRAAGFNLALSGDAVVQQLDPPSASPTGGTYTAVQTVTLSHTVPDVVVRYTTDGSTPTTSSTTYTAPFAVDQTTTVKAKAWKPSFTPSDVLTATYTLRVPTPSISPSPGTYNNAVSATISESLSGTTIRYTTDGSDPTESSATYSSAVTIDTPSTLKARAFKSGWNESNVASAAYGFKVATPSLSPAPGSYTGAQTLTITSSTTGATLRYTLDGTVPTASSPTVPGGGVLVDESTTVRVQGFRTNWTSSDVGQGSYRVTLGTVAAPTFSPSAGTFTESKSVTLSSTTSGATIRYTTDGTEPTAKSAIYSAAVLVYATTDLRAKAFKGDYTASSSTTGIFVIDRGSVDTPRLSPGPGKYTTFQTVTVTTETSGATLRYTTNGSEPTESDATVASGGTITVDKSMVVKVKAWKSGVPESETTRANYQITGGLSAGWNHSMALKADGAVWGWGSNASGQLGLGTTGSTYTSPVAATGISDVIAIAAGDEHALALKRNGTVWAWGLNNHGQLGDGTTTNRNAPVQVSSLSNVIEISAGRYHSVALKNDGTVYMWGNDFTTTGNTPRSVPELHGIVQVVGYQNHSFALQTDGEATGVVWAWGNNDPTSGTSALGDGTTSARPNPVRVAAIHNVTTVAAGSVHSFAVTNDGSIWAWGLNNVSQLGDGSGNNQLVPKVVALNLAGSEVRSLSGTTLSSIATVKHLLKSPNLTWAWGYNWDGAFGTGSAGPGSSLPVQSLMANADIVVGGRYYVLARALDASVWSWGDGANGVLGQGSTSDNSTPTAISSFALADNAWVMNDTDGDGLPSWLEFDLGLDPTSADTNGDGISDLLSVDGGINGTSVDVDNDGVSNAREIANGTDPFRADTDEDETLDGADCFPLDPERYQCPEPNPSDTTPPVITLIEPTNATLTSSNP